MKYVAANRFGGKGTDARQFTEALRGIAVDGEERIYVAGDSAVKVFDAEGALLRSWKTALPGFCITVDGEGQVWVGQWQQVEVFGPDGAKVRTWTDPERLGLVTAVAVLEDGVLLADASARWIRHYDRQGKFLNNIGEQHRKGGFHIPNGVLDFDVDARGLVHVANPGMHRVETYKPDGEYLGYFGKFGGTDPAGFPGCCNPTNLALTPDGNIVVTEKAGPRMKVFDPEGKMLALVGSDAFDPRCKNMDVATDGKGRIYVVDTERLRICVFEKRRDEG
jgi:DNA-binding beta-propeller fold protein YncE